MNLEIIYEDHDVVVVNKPAGLVVHPDGRTEERAVVDWFIEKYPESKDVGESIKLKATSSKPEAVIERPGVVHRIDRETSGCLVLAKTKKGHAHLKRQFQEREVEKIYHTFVYGVLEHETGTINLKIGRSKLDFRKRAAVRDGRDATTYYRVLKATPETSFVEARPKTGRTHQIRVHFQALRHPVVADKLYAPGKPGLLGFNRLALHAREVSFTNLAGERVSVEAPYPEDFQNAISMLN